MGILLIVGLACLFIALAIFMVFADDHNDGDMWIGMVFGVFIIIGTGLVIASGVWWLIKHFVYV